MEISIRDELLLGEEFPTPLSGMRELGLTWIELQLDDDFQVFDLETKAKVALKSEAAARDYVGRLKTWGVRPCALLTACDWSAGAFEDNVAWVTRAIELADQLGAPAVRIDSAMRRERELDFDMRVGLFVDGLAAALAATHDSPVTLGIENHGFQGNNLAFLLNVFQRVGSPRLGSTMDTGNFYWRGYPLGEVYGILALLAPHARHTHIKNINYPAETRETIREAGWEYGTYVCPLDEGDIDHARVVSLLQGAGYAGTLCLEDESLGKFAAGPERIAVLKRDVAYLLDVAGR